MASTSTPRYALVKPTPGTAESVNSGTDLWANMDKIDLNLGSRVCTSSTRPASPIAGMMIFETDTLAVRVWDATFSKWRLINPLYSMAEVATSETSTSLTYVDLATVGPAVTLYMTAGQNALVTIKARQSIGIAGAFSAHMSYAISGTETVAASDNNDNETVTVADITAQASSIFTASGVDGNRTFTAKHRVTGASTGTWRNRRIIVQLLSN